MSGKKTLTRWMTEKIDTPKWRSGSVNGMKHPEITQKEINLIGKRELLEQAEELEQKGLIQVDWTEFHNNIRRIHFSVDIMEELCRMEGIPNPKESLLRAKQELEKWRGQAPEEWVLPFYDKLLQQVSVGTVPAEVEIPQFFECLNAVVQEKEPVWKRLFSENIFGNSKTFKEQYENKILSILKKSPKVNAGMENYEILEEHGILSYAQKLELKGSLQFCFGEGHWNSTVDMLYGTILNSRTLEMAEPVGLDGVERIVAIENKANYESMAFRRDTLFLFCHGFFSPRERGFIRKMLKSTGEEIPCYHWGDLDFGGIRIYEFNKHRVFPNLQPLFMDRESYEKALEAGMGYPLEPQKRQKLAAIETEDLKELKECILERDMEIEQEAFLISVGLGIYR